MVQPGVPARVLIVAEAPSAARPGTLPLRGDAGRRLARVAGCALDRLLAPVDVVHMFDGPPTTPEDERTVAATLLEVAREDGRQVIVLLGRRVAGALGLVGPRPFQWRARWGFAEVAYSPHPSKGSHWWNDVKNLRRAEKFWRTLHRRAVEEQGEGAVAPKRTKPQGRASAIEGHALQRSEIEIAWLKDRVEDFYVASMSASVAARSLVEAHRRACEAGAELEHDGVRFLPRLPGVTRGRAAQIMGEVLQGWREREPQRVEEHRLAHHQSIAARILEAKAASEWPTVARLHQLLAEVDGVVGHPDQGDVSHGPALVVQLSSPGPVTIDAAPALPALEPPR